MNIVWTLFAGYGTALLIFWVVAGIIQFFNIPLSGMWYYLPFVYSVMLIMAAAGVFVGVKVNDYLEKV